MKKLLLIMALLINGYTFVLVHETYEIFADVRGMKVTADGASFPLGIDLVNTPNADTQIGLVHNDTGVDSHDTGFDSCKVTINAGDTTKIDIAECHVHIQGPEYPFDNITSLDPQFAAGENSRFIGVTMNGYTSQTSAWTYTQKQTVIPLARLNTALGVAGPGSVIHLIRSDRYFIYQNFYLDNVYHAEAMGAQYVTGGIIFANATSGLIIGQTAGVLYDAQKNRHVLAAFENRSALFINLSSNEVDWVATKAPLTMDAVNYNPAGSNLVPLLNDNTYTIHTIMKSPKGVNGTQEGELFFVYGDTQYGTAAAAIEAISDGSAVPRFGLFVDQATSSLVAVALVVQQKNAVAVDTILDRRPCQVCRP